MPLQNNGVPPERMLEVRERLKGFFTGDFLKQLTEAALGAGNVTVDTQTISEAVPEIVDFIGSDPSAVAGLMRDVVKEIDLPGPVRVGLVDAVDGELLIEPATKPEDFFDKKTSDKTGKTIRMTFIPKKLADHLMYSIPFKTLKDSGEMFSYGKDLWNIKAEHLIRNRCANLLENYSTSHRGKEVVEHIRSITIWEREDPPANLLPLLNGILDLESKKLLKYSSKFFFTARLPVNFDVTVEYDFFTKWLKEIVNEKDSQVLQEFVGYCFHRSIPYHKSLMLLGGGSNGKSTFLSIITAMLGAENVSGLSIQEISEDRFSAASLQQKLANIHSDLPSRPLQNLGKFKLLTGDDTVGAQKKFKDFFNFRNTAKFLFSANKLPESQDDTTAFYRRWLLVNFSKEISEKEAIPDYWKELTTPERLSGILNWALVGFSRLFKNKRFSRSETTEKTREHYIRASNPARAFCMDCLEEDGEGWISKRDLFGGFADYCNAQNVLPVTETTFFTRVRGIFGTSIRDEKRTIGKERKNGIRGLKMVKTVQTVQRVLGLPLSELAGKGNSCNKVEYTEPQTPGTPKTDQMEVKPLVDLALKKMGNSEVQKSFLLQACHLSERVIEKIRLEGLIVEITPGIYKKV